MQPNALQVVDRAEQAGALLDPIRLRLIAELAEPNSAAGLARKLALPRQRTNYHLRELERVGLLREVGQQRKRNCVERLLQATARAYVVDPALLLRLGGEEAAVRDRFSWAHLVSLHARAVRELATLRRRADAANQKLATLALDADIAFASPAELGAFAEELSNVLTHLVTRYQSQAAGARRFRVLLSAHPAITDAGEPATPEPEKRRSKRPRKERP